MMDLTKSCCSAGSPRDLSFVDHAEEPADSQRGAQKQLQGTVRVVTGRLKRELSLKPCQGIREGFLKFWVGR